MKALIIMGSPRKNGDCASLVNTFIKNFKGEVDIVKTFPTAGSKGIQPCIGCCACERGACVLKDDFEKIIKNDYDVAVVASPIYYSNLPGPMFNLISRFNFMYNQKIKSTSFPQKQGVIILTAGGYPCTSLMGESNIDLPLKQAKYILKRVNATLDEDNIVLSLKTDEVRAADDKAAQEKIAKIATKLNKKR